MRATPACQQLGGKRTTASGGADSEARRASRLDAGDHGRHRDHETDPVWSTGRERAFGVTGSIRGYRQASLAAGETRIVLAHAKDVRAVDGTVHHVTAGRGVLDYRHYLTLLRQIPVPLIVHGLAEADVEGALAFLRGALAAVQRETPAEVR